MAITVGCHSWSFAGPGLDDVLRNAAELGYHEIDLGTGGWLPPADLTRADRVARIADAVGLYGLVVTDVFLLLPNEPHTAVAAAGRVNRNLVRDACTNLGQLGTPGLTVSPGAADPEPDAWNRSVDALRVMVAIANERGLALSIEPHLGSIAPDVVRVRRLLDAVPGLTLTLDYSHFIAGGEVQSDIEVLDAGARHWHARQARPDRLATPRAEGTIDFARVVRRLAARGYDGSITVEYVRSSWQGQDQLDVDAENLAMRNELVGYLSDRDSASAAAQDRRRA